MRNRIGLLLGCAGLAAAAGCGSMTQETPTLAEKNLLLEKEVVSLRAELAARQENSVELAELFDLYFQHGSLSPILARRYLKTIRLPENPTPAEITEYLSRIYSLRRSNTDEEFIALTTSKIAEVGKANADKLIPYLNFTPFCRALVNLCGTESKELLRQALLQNRDSELTRAYTRLLTPEDADNVIAMLPENSGLLSAVKQLNLEKRAVPVMRKILRESSGNINYEREWLQMIADNSTPEENNALYESLWRRTVQQGMRNNRWQIAERGVRLAARGFQPAFTYLAENHRNLERNDTVRQLQEISNCGDQDFNLWYNANKDKIYFNAETMTWDVRP